MAKLLWISSLSTLFPKVPYFSKWHHHLPSFKVKDLGDFHLLYFYCHPRSQTWWPLVWTTSLKSCYLVSFLPSLLQPIVRWSPSSQDDCFKNMNHIVLTALSKSFYDILGHWIGSQFPTTYWVLQDLPASLNPSPSTGPSTRSSIHPVLKHFLTWSQVSVTLVLGTEKWIEHRLPAWSWRSVAHGPVLFLPDSLCVCGLLCLAVFSGTSSQGWIYLAGYKCTYADPSHGQHTQDSQPDTSK